MSNLRELRGRIKSIGGIKQITRAMEMVATTKLRRFQDRAVASRPYAEEIRGLVARLAAYLGKAVEDEPLFKDGAGEKTALLLVTSDRGLCGPYNSNVFRELEKWIAERGGDEAFDFFVIGRKGVQYLSSRGSEIAGYLDDPPLEAMDYGTAIRIARAMAEAFTSGKYKDVQMLFTAFESMVKYVPRRMHLLPIRADQIDAGEGGERKSRAIEDVILEPDGRTIFEHLVPRYLETTLFNALLESLTSEYASRRVSMKNATDAATDMVGVLKGIYNRKRQESITKELLDIVGGAEALK